MKVPKTFDLFGVKHTVDYSADVMDDKAKIGEYSQTHRQVRLYEKLEGKDEIFFHEIAEAIAVMLELKDMNGEELPHNVINGFGLGFYNLIVSNPQMFKER